MGLTLLSAVLKEVLCSCMVTFPGVKGGYSLASEFGGNSSGGSSGGPSRGSGGSSGGASGVPRGQPEANIPANPLREALIRQQAHLQLQQAAVAQERLERIEVKRINDAAHKETIRLERAAHNAQDLQTLSRNFNPNVMVPDPHNIGARGYVPGGINQPYARAIAAELETQDVAGRLILPNMDAAANRFLAQALPYLKPEAFGQHPTAVGYNSMITKKVIKDLKNMQ